MSDQYTPTTGHVRHVATERFAHRITGPEFDTWLATIKADAWQEGALWAAAECGVIEPDCPPEQWLTPGDNPYREGTEI